MRELRQVTSNAAVLDRADVDTDQIIPKQFLKRIERSGYGEFLFYDWMKDPALDSKGFEWDTACPGDQWRHSHNYMHHTHTNVLGKDRDIGYGILRMSEDQPWRRRECDFPLCRPARLTAARPGPRPQVLRVVGFLR